MPRYIPLGNEVRIVSDDSAESVTLSKAELEAALDALNQKLPAGWYYVRTDLRKKLNDLPTPAELATATRTFEQELGLAVYIYFLGATPAFRNPSPNDRAILSAVTAYVCQNGVVSKAAEPHVGRLYQNKLFTILYVMP